MTENGGDSRLYKWIAGVVVPLLVAAIAAGAWRLLSGGDGGQTTGDGPTAAPDTSNGPQIPDIPRLTPTPERDPERYSSAGGAWWYQYTDKTGIDTLLSREQARVIDVEAYGANSFSVVSLDNQSASYARTPEGPSTWTTGETQQSLAAKLDDKRMLDLERYTIDGQTRFAAAWVENTGAAAKEWYWWLGQTAEEIGTRLRACGCRLVDIDPIGSGRYDVIMIAAKGIDNVAWWWYVGIDQAQVTQHMTTNDARAVDLEPDGTGRFAVIMVKDGMTGPVAFDQTWEALSSGLPPATRYIHLRQYINEAGSTVWLAIGIKGASHALLGPGRHRRPMLLVGM